MIALETQHVCPYKTIMIRILFALFILLPLLELYVLIEVGSGIGGLLTISICLLTAALGGVIMRRQGLQTMLKAKESLAAAQQHELAEHAMHGVMLVIAGIMLFTPGFITDTLGFLLLLPFVRNLIIQTRFQPHTRAHQHTPSRYDEVLDVEVIDVEVIQKDK